MRCKFCFATFRDVKRTILPKGHLPRGKALEVVQHLVDFGFTKITFAGGEPTLCPWLRDLVEMAKKSGMTTMIVTNGSHLSNDSLLELQPHLDWIALSIDSINPATNLEMGRAISGNKPLTLSYYLELVDRVKEYGFGLKINTVVCRKNYSENLCSLIRYAKPLRWKLLQVLPIRGQNDKDIADFQITSEEFEQFRMNHRGLEEVTTIISESNELMTGSYVMVDPAGRFFDNTRGTHLYSRPILEIGAKLAIQQMNYDEAKFIDRGGIYNWDVSN